QGRLDNRLREVELCRQRLNHLQERMDTPLEEAIDLASAHTGAGMTPSPSPLPSPEAFWESIRQAGTLRVVLPRGSEDLEEAANDFVKRLDPEVLAQLDQVLQDRVLLPLGGLYAACASSGDLVRGLVMPLLDQAAQFLDQQLPITDVAQVELETAQTLGKDPATQIQEYMAKATPLVGDKDGKQQTTFVLVPASDAGRIYADEAQKAAADLQIVRVPGQSHLLFCREQGFLSSDDLQGICRPCRRAYEEAVLSPPVSPHARFDILDWVPLDP